MRISVSRLPVAVSKHCPFCPFVSKSWGETVAHINFKHFDISANEQTKVRYLGEYCGHCKRNFQSGRQAMKHIWEKHKP